MAGEEAAKKLLSGDALSQIAEFFSDKIGDEVSGQGVADTIQSALEEGKDNAWARFGNTILDNGIAGAVSGSKAKLAEGAIGEALDGTFDSGFFNEIIEHGISGEGTLESLGGALDRVEDYGSAISTILNQFKGENNEVKEKIISSMAEMGSSYSDWGSQILNDYRSGNLEEVMQYEIGNMMDQVREGGFTRDIYDAAMGSQKEKVGLGRLLASKATDIDELKKMKTGRFGSQSNMSKYNVANEIKNRADKLGEGEAFGDADYSSIARELDSRTSNPNFKDKAFYHKYPEKAAGGATLAFLVQGMSSKRGHMSNAELYGQAPPYGGPRGQGGPGPYY